VLLATLLTKGQISFLDWTNSSNPPKPEHESPFIQMKDPEENYTTEILEDDDNDEYCRVSDFI
jgi:hypothetical protein